MIQIWKFYQMKPAEKIKNNYVRSITGKYTKTNMKIPLNSFEQYIDETILKRGFQYFKRTGHEPEELMQGEYEAVLKVPNPIL